MCICWPTQDDGDIETVIARFDTVSCCEDMSVRQQSSPTLEVVLTNPDLQPGSPGELIAGGLAVPRRDLAGCRLLLHRLPLPALTVQVTPELAGGGENPQQQQGGLSQNT